MVSFIFVSYFFLIRFIRTVCLYIIYNYQLFVASRVVFHLFGTNFFSIAEFPADDIEVRLVHRERPTVEPPYPANSARFQILLNKSLPFFHKNMLWH